MAKEPRHATFPVTDQAAKRLITIEIHHAAIRAIDLCAGQIGLPRDTLIEYMCMSTLKQAVDAELGEDWLEVMLKEQREARN